MKTKGEPEYSRVPTRCNKHPDIPSKMAEDGNYFCPRCEPDKRIIIIPLSLAWEGIDACYKHSKELLESAVLLFDAQKYISSKILAIYAAEEADKGTQILTAYKTCDGRDLEVKRILFKKHEQKSQLDFRNDGFGWNNIDPEGNWRRAQNRVNEHKNTIHVGFDGCRWFIPNVDRKQDDKRIKEARLVIEALGRDIEIVHSRENLIISTGSVKPVWYLGINKK